MTVLEKANQKRDAAERGMEYNLPGYDRSNLQWWTAYIEGAEDQKREDTAAIEALQAENETLHQHIEDLNGAFRIESEARQKAEAAQPHWVSVEERLPKDGEWVLVWGDGFHVPVEVFREHGAWLDSQFEKFTGVTHWMPLPEPPQEVQDGK